MANLSNRQLRALDPSTGVAAYNPATDFLSPHLGAPPRRLTHRELSRLSPKGRHLSQRQKVSRGGKSLYDRRGMPIPTAAARSIGKRIARTRKSRQSKATFVRARLDAAHGLRPMRLQSMLDRRWGDHIRRETESQGDQAAPGDQRGHGFPQASTSFAPGVHRALMVSQSPLSNMAIQQVVERGADQIMQDGRVPIMEVRNEFGAAPPPAGQLPQPHHQTFSLFSTTPDGEDLRAHTHFRTSRR